jgi:tetratricopeptide (TPR) repeat protein
MDAAKPLSLILLD